MNQIIRSREGRGDQHFGARDAAGIYGMRRPEMIKFCEDSGIAIDGCLPLNQMIIIVENAMMGGAEPVTIVPEPELGQIPDAEPDPAPAPPPAVEDASQEEKSLMEIAKQMVTGNPANEIDADKETTDADS